MYIFAGTAANAEDPEPPEAGYTRAVHQQPQVRDLNAAILTGALQRMVDRICGHTEKTAGRKGSENASEIASASFGNDCRGPIVPAMREGPRLCPQFQKCLDCPGLVIPIDVEHLALLLRANRAFESARKQLRPERWKLYLRRERATPGGNHRGIPGRAEAGGRSNGEGAPTAAAAGVEQW